MDHPRRVALVAGGLYLVTIVTSIPALALKAPVPSEPGIIDSSGATSLMWARILEIVLAIACAGTAIVLYPITRLVSESAALGFVCAGVVESTIILVGVASLLSPSTLNEASVGAEPSQIASQSALLVAVHDWAFLLGPGLIPAINALLLGTSCSDQV